MTSGIPTSMMVCWFQPPPKSALYVLLGKPESGLKSRWNCRSNHPIFKRQHVFLYIYVYIYVYTCIFVTLGSYSSKTSIAIGKVNYFRPILLYFSLYFSLVSKLGGFLTCRGLVKVIWWWRMLRTFSTGESPTGNCCAYFNINLHHLEVLLNLIFEHI